MHRENNILLDWAESGTSASLAPTFFPRRCERKEVVAKSARGPSPATGFAMYANPSAGRPASVRQSRSETDVRMPAPAMVALMKNPCHHNGDCFDIARSDIRGGTEAGKLFAAVRLAAFRLAS